MNSRRSVYNNNNNNNKNNISITIKLYILAVWKHKHVGGETTENN